MEYNKLTSEEESVIVHKGTERPFTGEYVNNKRQGTYFCRRCNAPLYKSTDKFDSHCGWPSFDDAIDGAIERIPDADGKRVEIICAHCKAHLGHVFLNEGFTPKETRYCVNSISLKFKEEANQSYKLAYFAGGCFWGIEYYFMKMPGVIHTTVGYMGGNTENPDYEDVCGGKTGHLEVVKVEYDQEKVSYEDLLKLFFEIHDFTQQDGQGPDIGNQYLSCIFYTDKDQKELAQKYITVLNQKGYRVATTLKLASKFWIAEEYHQQYYEHKGTKPYCHIKRKIF